MVWKIKKSTRIAWNKLSDKEKDKYNEFAKSELGRMYILAYESFTLHQTKGIRKELFFHYLNIKLTQSEEKYFEFSYNLLKEKHKEVSRKGFEKKFRQ